MYINGNYYLAVCAARTVTHQVIVRTGHGCVPLLPREVKS